MEIIQNEIDMSQMNLPWVESPFFSDIIKTKNLPEEDKKLASEYYENGFIVLSNIFTNELIDQIKSEMNDKGFNENFPIQTFRNNIRIQDLWQYSDSVKELACHPKIMDTLKMLYEREPVPFQTLNFKVGTQQKAHSDTLPFSSLPARYMCGVWVALEDITEDNGPLFYYPGSHRNPEYNFSVFIFFINAFLIFFFSHPQKKDCIMVEFMHFFYCLVLCSLFCSVCLKANIFICYVSFLYCRQRNCHL